MPTNNPKKLTDEEARQEVMRIVCAFFNNDKGLVNEWLYTANPLLGGIQPMVFINMGRVQKLLKCMKNWQAGEMP